MNETHQNRTHISHYGLMWMSKWVMDSSTLHPFHLFIHSSLPTFPHPYFLLHNFCQECQTMFLFKIDWRLVISIGGSWWFVSSVNCDLWKCVLKMFIHALVFVSSFLSTVELGGAPFKGFLVAAIDPQNNRRIGSWAKVRGMYIFPWSIIATIGLMHTSLTFWDFLK